MSSNFICLCLFCSFLFRFLFYFLLLTTRRSTLVLLKSMICLSVYVLFLIAYSVYHHVFYFCFQASIFVPCIGFFFSLSQGSVVHIFLFNFLTFYCINHFQCIFSGYFISLVWNNVHCSVHVYHLRRSQFVKNCQWGKMGVFSKCLHFSQGNDTFRWTFVQPFCTVLSTKNIF